MAPVLVLWLMGRIASVIVLSWIGADVNNLNLEQSLMEDFLHIGSVPETSFLDLLTALAVMPLAAFTTLACLGGGSGTPPEWMRLGNEIEIKSPDEEKPGLIVTAGKAVGTVAGTAVGIGVGMTAVAASGIAAKTQAAGTSAIAAANATPQGIQGGLDLVNTTSDSFSFIDEGPAKIEPESIVENNEDETEFEGFGSMFD